MGTSPPKGLGKGRDTKANEALEDHEDEEKDGNTENTEIFTEATEEKMLYWKELGMSPILAR
jgi:hypothetical protein